MSSKQEISAAYLGRRVLLTGASGFIGRWVARALTAAGADLRLVAREPGTLATICDAYEIRGRVLTADLAELGVFTRLYHEVRPDITFHLAGYGVDPSERDPRVAEALNTRLVAEIAETIGTDTQPDWRGLQLVHTGSAFEYGNMEGTLTEDSPAVPSSLYGETKLAGTKNVLAARASKGLRASVARLFTVYGPGEHSGRLLPSLLRVAQTGESLPLTGGQQMRDFTYVEEVAEGLLRLGLAAQAPGIINLATGRLTSVRGFAECAAEALALRRGQLQFGAIPYRPDELRQGRADTGLLEKTLGWRPSCPVQDGIRRTIAFEAAQQARASAKG